MKKYGDAVIPHIAGHNRDPKAVFCEEWNAYALSLYLEKDIFGIFRSKDLVNLHGNLHSQDLCSKQMRNCLSTSHSRES